MKKSVQVLLVLALVFCGVYCQNSLSGMTGWNPRVPGNDQSCFMSVSGVQIKTGVVLGQAYRTAPSQPPSQIPAQCHYFNFVFDSVFHGDNINSQLDWQNSTDPTNFVVNATLDANALVSNNGTACVFLPQTQVTGVDQYLCKMKYDNLPVYLAVWCSLVNAVIVFDTAPSIYSNWPLAEEHDNEPTMQANFLALNTTFPSIVPSLYDSCGSNTNVSTLTAKVTVTTAVNLTTYLPGMWLAYTIIKKKGSSGDYLTIVSQSKTPLFDTYATNGCWDMGIKYSDLLPDMNYCANGCDVSFVLATNVRQQIYVMETARLWTKTPSIGGNGGSSSGNGGSGSVGTGSGNNGGVVVSSGLSMGINLFALVIAIAYIHWL